MEESPVPQVEESCSEGEDKTNKEKLLCLLDRVEVHVERLRRESLVLEEKRDSLFTTLDALRNSQLLSELNETDKEDIERYIERVTTRCTTVEILVRTERDESQEDALSQVNLLIDSLVISFKINPGGARSRCLSYMAACCSQPDVPSDKSFESALLGCALDDQKKIKKRLRGLFSYLEQDGKLIPMPED